jgi:two-component system response regulator DevR
MAARRPAVDHHKVPRTPLRVMVVDDHELVRRAVILLLEAAGDIAVCGEAAAVAEAGPVADASDPDVAVIDLRLPDGSGVQACREIRARRPNVQVVLLTAVADEEALAAAVVSGASGYVLKQVRGTDVVEGVRAAAGGRCRLDPGVFDAVLRTLGAGLSEEERELLALVAAGTTDAQIAQRRGVDEATVKALVDILLAKVGVTRRPVMSGGPGRLPR